MTALSTPVQAARRTPANVGSVALDARLAAELRKAGQKAEDWRERRDELIRLAHVDGASLREIAAAVGLSNPGVLRILRRGTSEAPPLIADALANQIKRDLEARRRHEQGREK